MIVGVVPLVVYLLTASADVAFDDAAEFALCARDWSPAHPPGGTLFVAAAALWLTVAGGLGSGGLGSYVAVSALNAVFAAAGSVVLYRAIATLLRRVFADVERQERARDAAALAALAGAFGATMWQWSNSAEVYALQFCAAALALHGVVRPGKSMRTQLLLGLGIGVGLGNHHVSMVLMVPFLVVVAAGLRGVTLIDAIRALLPAFAIATGIMLLSWLLLATSAVTAADDAALLFGQPDSPSRLWHHLSGGFFRDSLMQAGVDYAGRARVLGEVLLWHLGPFWIAAAFGVRVAWRRARYVLGLALRYPAVLALLQLLRMHTANMDATLLPALGVLTVLAAIGLNELFAWRRAAAGAAAAAALALLVAINCDAGSRRGYRAGTAVLEDVSRSCPDRALVLLSSWELQTLTRLAIEERDYRSDLVIVPASFKGPHKGLFPRQWPELHGAVAQEYDAFLAAIAAVDPDYVYTDWFTLDSEAQLRTYRALLDAAVQWARRDNRTVLCDRTTVAFLLSAKLVDGGAVSPTGMLFAIGPPPPDPAPFELADGWLEHPFLQHDLCAMGVLHDYRTAARQIAGYWRHRGKRELATIAEATRDRLDAIWNAYQRGKPAPRQAR